MGTGLIVGTGTGKVLNRIEKGLELTSQLCIAKEVASDGGNRVAGGNVRQGLAVILLQAILNLGL